MAEIGLIASIVGVSGAGAKLAITIFDFASTIGAAGQELQNISTEISLLCSVLKQLETVLAHAHFQSSREAVHISEKILRRCETVFQELDLIVSGLCSGKTDNTGPFPAVDFVAKVKWTFKRSKVQLLRSTLESCKLTLGVMLSTMQLAEKASMRRMTIGASATRDDEQDRLTTQSLIISQQCSLQRLEYFEEEVEKEESLEMRLPDTSANISTKKRRRSRPRFLQMFSGLSVDTSFPTGALENPPTRSERASVWLGAVVFGSDLDAHPGTLVRRRLSSVDTKDAPGRLLRMWTDQGRDAESLVVKRISSASKTEGWRDSNLSNFSFNPSQSSATDERSQLRSWGSNDSTFGKAYDISPKSPRKSSIVAGQKMLPQNIDSLVAFDPNMAGNIAPEHPPETIVSMVLKSFGVVSDPADFTLRLVYAGREHTFSGVERPFEVFMQYQNMKVDPLLFICKSAGSS